MVSIRDSKIKDYLPSPSSISSAPKVNVAPAPGIVHGDKLRPMVPKIGLKYTYYLVEKDSIKYNWCEVCLHGYLVVRQNFVNITLLILALKVLMKLINENMI